MLRVYKFLLQVEDYYTVTMPRTASIINVDFQHGQLYIWALCAEVEEKFEPRTFRIAGTGHPIDESFTSLLPIGTAKLESLVFHVFQVL